MLEFSFSKFTVSGTYLLEVVDADGAHAEIGSVEAGDGAGKVAGDPLAHRPQAAGDEGDEALVPRKVDAHLVGHLLDASWWGSSILITSSISTSSSSAPISAHAGHPEAAVRAGEEGVQWAGKVAAGGLAKVGVGVLLLAGVEALVGGLLRGAAGGVGARRTAGELLPDLPFLGPHKGREDEGDVGAAPGHGRHVAEHALVVGLRLDVPVGGVGAEGRVGVVPADHLQVLLLELVQGDGLGDWKGMEWKVLLLD